MERNWYYTQNGKRVGPVDSKQLRKLARSGSLKPTDLVCREGRSRWAAARSVNGLFPEPSSFPKGEWHVARDGKRLGPFTWEHLEQMAGVNMLQRSDRVWRADMPDWVAAGSIADLFRQPPSPPPPPRDPPIAGSGKYSAQDFEKLWERIKKVGWPLLGTLGLMMLVPNKEFNILAFLLNLITLVVVTNLLLYRMWALIQDGQARTTPGKAIGYRFIPFFSMYWEIVVIKGLRDDIMAYAKRRGVDLPQLPENVFLCYCIGAIVSLLLGLIPYLGFLTQGAFVVLQFYVLYLLKNASVAIAQSVNVPGTAGAQDGTVDEILKVVQVIGEWSESVEKSN